MNPGNDPGPHATDTKSDPQHATKRTTTCKTDPQPHPRTSPTPGQPPPSGQTPCVTRDTIYYNPPSPMNIQEVIVQQLSARLISPIICIISEYVVEKNTIGEQLRKQKTDSN